MENRSDYEVFREHRKLRAQAKPGYKSQKASADSKKLWNNWSQAKKDEEAKRLRGAATTYAELADVPTDAEAEDEIDDDEESDDAGAGDMGYLPDAADEEANDNSTGSSDDDGDVAMGGPRKGMFRAYDDPEGEMRKDRQAARKKYGEGKAPDLDDIEWVYQKHLGSGGNGSAHLWVQVDGKDIIQDRIAVKDCWTDGPFHWGSVKFWDGDPRDMNPEDRLPVEVKAMQACQNKPGSHRIAGIRDHSVDFDRMAYRIIMPFYARGDFITIIDKADDNYHVPEPFIWCAFEALADACLVMERASIRKADQPPDNWREIVHRDIKPDNVFLTARNPRSFPSYPQPVLADFGGCIMTSKDDILNPTAYADSTGTLGYFAPEQHAYEDKTTYEAVFVARQQSWTNIYQIGRVIMSLMNAPAPEILSADELKKGAVQEYLSTDPLYDDPDGWKDHEWFKPETRGRYSKELQNLVKSCVRYKPDERITAVKLKGKILRRTGGVRNGKGKDFAKGLRSKKVAKGGEGDLRGWRRKDTYAVGLVRPEK
ncbi:hypothetical protein CBER1_09257 [Cercospora berteroae]|uniref:non-specific serine/threonine protein kinase n=1 Tax=Cercospora berteroae TaxID=357750 RepID=A0A2S6BXU2_9PEZI|nr:hypothetical protein CBER1_09257 [Cercospora berteroae]